MDAGYAQRYGELFRRHWWWRARERVVLRELDLRRPSGGWRRALDVGCGDGLFLDTLLRYADEAEGIEPDEAIVSEATRAAGRVHVRPFDATYRPDHTFDLVVLLDVLEHIRDAEAAVSHAASLMEEGGTLLVTVPAFRSLWTTHDELNLHVTRYTREELVDQLSIGFEVDTVRYFFRWIHPVKLVQAAVEALRRPEPRPPTVPWAPVNAALYGLSRVEEALLRRVPLAMGSSLIAVATKR